MAAQEESRLPTVELEKGIQVRSTFAPAVSQDARAPQEESRFGRASSLIEIIRKDIKNERHHQISGRILAFYACYDAEGNISTEGVKALTRHLIAKGVKGVYVGGSSGECIYQHVDERKAVLEAVMSEAKGN